MLFVPDQTRAAAAAATRETMREFPLSVLPPFFYWLFSLFFLLFPLVVVFILLCPFSLSLDQILTANVFLSFCYWHLLRSRLRRRPREIKTFGTAAAAVNPLQSDRRQHSRTIECGDTFVITNTVHCTIRQRVVWQRKLLHAVNKEPPPPPPAPPLCQLKYQIVPRRPCSLIFTFLVLFFSSSCLLIALFRSNTARYWWQCEE